MQHFFRHFRFDNYTIKDFLNETTYGFDEVFGSYAYNGYGAELASTFRFAGYRSACTDFSVYFRSGLDIVRNHQQRQMLFGYAKGAIQHL